MKEKLRIFANAVLSRLPKNPNAQKPKKHKQSKYFSVMLVPHSSSKKPWTIRIPYIALQSAGAVLAALVIAVLFANFRATYYTTKATAAEQNFEEEQAKTSQLLEEKKDVDEEKKAYEDLLEKERADYQAELDRYEQKALELETKIKEIDDTKDAIYNLLSQKTDNARAVEYKEAIPSPAVMLSQNPSSKGTLDNKYTEIAKLVDMETNNYQSLLAEAQKVRKYIDARPSLWPVRGVVTSEMGSRPNPFGGGSENHAGLDISVPIGTPVHAGGAGTVVFAGWNAGGYGNLVIIDHGYGIRTMYGHNSSVSVNVGDFVEKGGVIALSGSTGQSTGPHVHYEIRVNGAIKNPRNFLG
ncbi:hypothetical protein AGMMS49975_11640 [Clostridia bacterium]|nr:hypothetical protein AGMMS49975_11640 [Clostridia bacterium]GHU77558.1 hypothetical protein FACS1894188_12090 [Clostridia bacterium]